MKFQPKIFNRIHLRGGIKYRDLGNHSFTVIEFFWKCEEIRGVHTTCTSTKKPTTFKNVSFLFNVPISRLCKWLRWYRSGRLVDESDRSRPIFIWWYKSHVDTAFFERSFWKTWRTCAPLVYVIYVFGYHVWISPFSTIDYNR